MIDLHCHILPGIDDGASSVAESILMAREAEKEGITSIVATPHHKNGTYENAKENILLNVAKLNEELEKASINVRIHPGQEIRIYGEILEDYKKGEILSASGHSSYLFIEFPSNSVPYYAERLFYNIQLAGLFPVIVHPERNQEFIKCPDKLYSFVKHGAATQITAASYTGQFGKKIQLFTEKILRSNLAHFIASDAHNRDNRSFKLASAYKRLKERMGEEYTQYFIKNAEMVVKGKEICKEPPEEIRQKRKFLGVF